MLQANHGLENSLLNVLPFTNLKVNYFIFNSGNSEIVLKPKSTQEVSTILKYCNERSLAVVPQGGNTGLVGGSVPVHDEVILSMSLMDKIISIDDVSGINILFFIF